MAGTTALDSTTKPPATIKGSCAPRSLNPVVLLAAFVWSPIVGPYADGHLTLTAAL